LWGSDEHFDQVIVQAIVKLALKAPFELRIVQIARMQIEVIRVHWDAWIPKLDDQLDAIALGARIEIKQRMLVETKLGENALQSRIATVGHTCIVKVVKKNSIWTER
jgi:hypothetical protein